MDDEGWFDIRGVGDRRRHSSSDPTLPQQGSLENLVLAVKHHRLTAEQLRLKLRSTRGPDVSKRIAEYYQGNARGLGFLDRENIATPAGRALNRLSTLEMKTLRIAYAFEASYVGEQWIRFCRVKRLEDVPPATAEAFVDWLRRKHPNKRTLSWAHRAQTLKSWLDRFKAARAQLPLVAHPPQRRLPLGGSSVVLGTRRSGELLELLAQGSRVAQIGTAYFSLGGYIRVADRLKETDLQLLIGRDDSSKRHVQAILEMFKASIARRIELVEEFDGLQRRQVILKLYDQLVRGRVRVRRFDPRISRGTFHAKVFLFDRDRAFVGSANLSEGGLQNNIECGYLVSDPDEVAYLVDRFESYFDDGVPFSEKLLSAIEESWVMHDDVAPRDALLKALHLLFGRVPRIDAPEPLADFQKSIVATVLRRFETTPRVLLVAPTGIGKTLMGAYVAAALRKRVSVDRVIIVAKNRSMRDAWEHVLRQFRMPSDCVRAYDLERDAGPDSPVAQLSEVYGGLRKTDLLLVDECHHYRRDVSHRHSALARLLEGSDPDDRPHALLMTATPVSVGLDDLTALLRLLDSRDPGLRAVEEIAVHPSVVNVSVGQVHAEFGVTHRGRIGLHVGSELRFYPRIKLKTVPYEGADLVFDALQAMDFTIGAAGRAPRGVAPEGRHGMIRALLGRVAESSMPALEATVGRLREGATSGQTRPMDPIRFGTQLDELERIARTRRERPDPKFVKLAAIVKRGTSARRKVLIFTEYLATADYLTKGLRDAFPALSVESVTGAATAKQRRELFRRFAPFAQKVSTEPESPIDVLVATDAISEGENLQDAEVIVNYDLNWTPLRLVQRVGRAYRFAERRRRVRVFNFFPDGAAYELLVSLHARLDDRSAQVKAITDLDYLGEGSWGPEDLAASTHEAVAKLYVASENQEFEALLMAETLRTPTVASQYWEADPKERQRAQTLPDGIHAVGEGPRPGMFVLVRAGNRNVALFRHATGFVDEAPRFMTYERVMANLAGVRGTRKPSADTPIDSHIAETVCRWLERGGVGETRVRVLVAIKVLPSALG